jgi:hypothetical protein
MLRSRPLAVLPLAALLGCEANLAPRATGAATARSRKISALLVPVVVALVGCTTTVRQNPNCAAWRSQLAAVAVMPPDVKVHLVTFESDNPSFADDAANLRGRLRGAIAKVLEAHGFGVGDQGGF